MCRAVTLPLTDCAVSVQTRCLKMNTLMHVDIYTLVCSCNTIWCSHVAVGWFWKRQMSVCCFVIVFRVVEHLLRHGADPALRDHAGYTATHYAALNGHRLTLEMVFTIWISIGAMGWTSVTISHSLLSRTAYCLTDRDVIAPPKICICRIEILYFKSVGFEFGCGFVTQSRLKYSFDC